MKDSERCVEANESQLNLRLRKALEEYAAGDQGQPAEVVLAQIKNEAAARRNKER